jgi:hypothetical protein
LLEVPGSIPNTEKKRLIKLKIFSIIYQFSKTLDTGIMAFYSLARTMKRTILTEYDELDKEVDSFHIYTILAVFKKLLGIKSRSQVATENHGPAKIFFF